MKKITVYFLIVVLLLSLAIPAFASEQGSPWVVDNAGLLSDEEIVELSLKIQTLRSELELEIVIVTTYGTGSMDVQQYADDFYDSNSYGYGSNNTGILLLLDMQEREWYMSTCGDAIYIFTDYGLSLLGDEILPWLSSGDYYEAFDSWLDALPEFVEAYEDQAPIDGYVSPDAYDSPYGDEIYHYEDHVGTPVHAFPIALCIGLAAALIAVLVMRSRMNTAKMQSGAVDYLKKDSFYLRRRSDMFLYSRVSRVAKPKNNTSGGGGSSVHRSSGGISHGGRGGRF